MNVAFVVVSQQDGDYKWYYPYYHHHQHFHYHDQEQPRAIQWNNQASYDLKANSQFVEATFRFPNNSSFQHEHHHQHPITSQSSSQVIEAKNNVDGFVLN